MAEEMKWQAGVNTHENVIFSCFGGASNTGITSGLASLEAVKELGLEKAAIMCLGGLSADVKPVFGKTGAAKNIITVDGCPFECARKIVEQAGFKPTKSIVLTRDISMNKKGFSEDIGKEIKGIMDYISDSEVSQAKDLIVRSIIED
jgi:uncharacterized metal-binding protein